MSIATAHSSLQIETEPAIEPVTLDEARTQCRVTNTAENDLIEQKIVVARRYVEHVTRRALIYQTWNLYLDEFPDVIEVPKPPLSSVTHLKYIDNEGTLTTLVEDTDYQVDTYAEPGRVGVDYNKTWPTTRDDWNAVQLRFVAGYGETASEPRTYVPAEFRQAILMLVVHWWKTREPILIGAMSREIEVSVCALLNINPHWEF